MTRNYFEEPEYKHSMLNQWNELTLRSVIGKNSGKSTEEYLQLLVKDLRHLQYGLKLELRTEDFLYNKLVTTCKDILACRYTCCKPNDSLAGFLNDLQSSITTYESCRKAGNLHAF
jgi:hypothetical protein